MFFLYFSLLLFFILLLPSRQRKEKLICFIFLIENNHFTLNESFCFYLTFFLLALPNSVHPKILTRFYSIYVKTPLKISAQSDGRIENYTQ